MYRNKLTKIRIESVNRKKDQAMGYYGFMEAEPNQEWTKRSGHC